MKNLPPTAEPIELPVVPGVLIGLRAIAPGDEDALMPQERGAYCGSVVGVRRASGAARIAARELLARLGVPPSAIPRAQSGMPIWPQNVIGSLAHDSHIAVAAVARLGDYSSLGIDIEPAQLLDADLLDMVATARERRYIGDEPYRGRVLFTIKEAVYKAAYPLDGEFLDHHDVEVDLATGGAAIRNGRRVKFCYCLSSRIIALAFIQA